MLSLKCDPSQTKLTDYYKLVTEIDLLSKSNPELIVRKAFDNANEEQKRMLEISSSDNKSF